MEEILALAGQCRVASAHDSVLNSECCFTFHSPYTTAKGILVNLNTFMGTCQDMAMSKDSSGSNSKELFVRIVKQRVQKKDNEDANGDNKTPTKLAIGVEGGFQTEEDKYEDITSYSVVVMEQGKSEPIVELPYSEETKQTFPEMVIQSVDSIIHHAGMTVQQDVKVWQLDADEEIPVSKYAENLPFVDNGVVIDPNPKTWKCQKSGDTENLWLNLSDGYIGGGRKNWDGSGGSNGALDHYEETGCLYPLVVKLGTITADLDTADCYSYAKDEDGPVKIPNLAQMLEMRGINVSAMQKTVKSTAELEVELNANYAFDAITEAGSELTPVSGPGLQGLQNLGNSCYMNSVVQMLLSGTVPELAKRYGTSANGSLTQHPFSAVSVKNAPLDLLCQTVKVACALTSGTFAKPVDLADVKEEDGKIVSNDPKYRLAPRMFKHVVGKDHVEFRTGHQQDAPEFLQYLLERMDRAELGAAAQYPGHLRKGSDDGGNVHVSSHLFSFKTTSRRVCSGDGKVKYSESAPENIWSLPIPMDKAVVPEKKEETGENENEIGSPEQKRQKSEDSEENKPIPSISFDTCLEEWAKDRTIEGVRWPHLQNAVHPGLEMTRLSNFPRYLIVQMQRYVHGPDWVPMKLEVNLQINEEIDLDSYKSKGPQENEVMIPEEEGAAGASGAPAPPVIDEAALSQLMDMGFSLNSCKRALNAVGGNNVEAAMSWVFEHNMDPDFNDPLPEGGGGDAGASSASGVDEGVVQSLVENLGCFTADQVRAALEETGGAADRAADWLFSHMDDIDNAIASLKAGKSESGAGASQSSAALEDGPGKYVMIGMISHIGKNTGSGHYVVHLKKDGKWVIFNDEKVALSSHPPSEHAYLYLFQRKDTIGSPHPGY